MLVDITLKSDTISKLGYDFSDWTRTFRVDVGLYKTDTWNPEFQVEEELKSAGLYDEPVYYSYYGVCDSPIQLLEKFGKLINESNKKYVIFFVLIKKEDLSEYDDWRWNKWGPYVGNQSPQSEYLFDEPIITEIYTYHIYEVQ